MTGAADEAVRRLIGPGGPYEVIEYAAQGTTFPFFKTAPENLREFYRSALVHGDKTFYVFQDRRYSFTETWRMAARVAHALRENGIEKGDRVGIAMRNYPEWVFSFMAITSIGAMAVAVNAWWSREELTYGIKDSGMKALFVDDERLERIDPEHTELTVIAAQSSDAQLAQALVPAIGWEAFLPGEDVEMPEVPVELEDSATLFYTSGSTAHPKGVVSTHRAVIAAVMGFEAGAAIGQAMAGGQQAQPQGELQPATILTVPLFHTTGLIVQFLSSFRPGRKLVGMYKWDPEEALRIIERERITQFNGVPTMAWELVQSPKLQEYDLSSLQSMGGGGAAMAPEHARQIRNTLKGGVPGTGYGLTETNALTASIAGEALAERPRSCGRPIPPLVSVKIVDDDGNALQPGETGEICVKGANVFKEYWKRPEETAATLQDGWVYTGDLGHVDEEGYIFITDRKKDMVIRGGENIGCQEVEAVIWDHPAVDEVAVFGVPDERLGETLAAVIAVKPDHGLSDDEIKRHVGEHLARFKVPDYIWLRDEKLPRIASGKIYKRGLRDDAIRELEGQRS